MGKLKEWAKDKQTKGHGGPVCVTCKTMPKEALEDLVELAKMNREGGNAPSQRTLVAGLREVYGYAYGTSALQGHLSRCIEGGWSG